MILIALVLYFCALRCLRSSSPAPDGYPWGKGGGMGAGRTLPRKFAKPNRLYVQCPMDQRISAQNYCDDAGNPTGGSVVGAGIRIDWQEGPLGTGEDRVMPNGAFVEGVIKAAIQRLEFFQASKFSCRENAIALTHLETALLWMGKRTADREARGVEGTHAK